MKTKEPKQKSKKPEEKITTLRLWMFAGAIALVAVLANVNTFENGYVLDDLSAITENSVVKKGTEGVSTIWTTSYRYGYWTEQGSLFRPLALTLFAWEWQVWPENPRPAHIINVLLFAGCCVALFFLFINWFGREKYILSLLSVLLFALHPIHTEVVANIKSADELLAVLFSALALIALWKNGERWFSLWVPLAVVSFFLAVSSKESVVTLIPVVPLAFWFFSKVPLKKAIANMSWLFVPFAVYMFLRYEALGRLGGKETIAGIDNMLVRAHGIERFTNAVKICGMYLWKLVFPHPLAHDYSLFQIPITGIADPLFWISLIAYGGLFWLIYKGWKTKSIWSFAIIFFMLTFSLYSNIVMTIGTHFGERLLFLPSIGFCLGIGWLFWRWSTLKTNGQFVLNKSVLPITILVLTLVAYTAKTTARNSDWHSAIELYEADIKNSPNSARTHYRLGMAYMKERAILINDKEERNAWIRKSIGALKEAVRIYPTFTDALSELGLAYQRLGYRDLAVERYQAILAKTPNHKVTLNNMGTVLFEQGKFDAAIEHFLKAIKQDPRYFDAMGNLASCYGTIGQYDEAIKWFKEALEHDPKNASYHYFMGMTYQRMNRENEASVWLERAYRLDPKLRPKQ